MNVNSRGEECAGTESEVICDRRLVVRPKGKVYKTIVRPAPLYGLDTKT